MTVAVVVEPVLDTIDKYACFEESSEVLCDNSGWMIREAEGASDP